ncbi:hypothetical protein PRIPAC_81358 [Pristionchus pacificus]|uniref:Nuclear receptor n=1 Tax=Pristionchus pacificus TaxID=54126 RepID=A0A2A6CQJ5_PRIPA|nr:hypothetical protein PRIPAC_81358 [Pristionchus pacificus]|eukprot:PDM80390.1 nuclear receptor [Pristionchus pacificus]
MRMTVHVWCPVIAEFAQRPADPCISERTACATFFKRANQSGIILPCRQGDRKCSLIRDSGSKCRGCRYAKCIEIGMVKEDKDVKENNKEDFFSEISTEFTKRDSVNISENSLLERMATEYALLKEDELVKLHNLERIPHPTEQAYLTTHTTALAAHNIAAAEICEFFLTVFPSVKELSHEDQRELFRLHFLHFLIVDIAYRTNRVWGAWTKYSYCSVLMCTDIQQPERWIGVNEGGPKRDEFLESIRTYTDLQIRLILPSYLNANFCEMEHLALIVLLLCESDLPNGVADRCHWFLENLKKEILEELHHFYTYEMGLTNYSTRIGNLMTVCHTFREGCMNFREFFRMHVTLFDVYTTETLMQELLL